ncbi:MAG: PhoX family phosphatase [Microcystaceae cyanobacterium]
MTINRRDFLIFMGLGLGSTLASASHPSLSNIVRQPTAAAAKSANLPFTPLQLPLPLPIDNFSDKQQKNVYQRYEVKDDLLLPPEYTYDVIAAWGDRLGDSRVGYNNDYLALIETSPNEGYLVSNFEYISGRTWANTYPEVIQKSLPFADVKDSVAQKNPEKNTIDAYSLSDNDPLKAQIKAISQEGLIDQGLGIMSVRRKSNGQWERTNSSVDRRITGISGLNDGRYLKATGPATVVFEKSDKMGYDDGLGAKIIGTFQNCAGGISPWGTVFSAEENVQNQIPEAVMADGSSFDPATRPFLYNKSNIDGLGNVFALAGNKYGWMVEVDPANPQDYGTKHTWLGRYRHEAVAFRVVAGKPLAAYSGCDRRGGHLYKFVSQKSVRNPKDKANSQLFNEGMLYGAKFNPDGTGKWIPLTLDTPIDPILPSQVEGKNGVGMVPLPNPNRQAGGFIKVTNDQEIAAFKDKFKTLEELYQGNKAEKQGAILIDAHFAANAVGITATARPEDAEVSPDGTLYVAYTSGAPGGDGGPDKKIFQGPNGETDYEFGWIMSLKEDKNDPSSLSFRWNLFATGGEPASGGLGFSNPDNLAVDNDEHIWMVTDMSTSKHNKPVPQRTKGQKTGELVGIFGNNTAWFIPTSGKNAGNAYPFAIGPMETEICGLHFTRDQETLFLAIQHPGEISGSRQNGATKKEKFVLKTNKGEEFTQERIIPVGSNWPSGKANSAPRPAIVAVRRIK